MINPKLLDPKSIVVCGASSDIHKPGGKALKNLLESAFKGEVYAVNPKETEVQYLIAITVMESFFMAVIVL